MAESKFNKLASKLGKRKGVTNPRALAAWIGDKKLGKEEMAKKSAASREKHHKESMAKLKKRKRH